MNLKISYKLFNMKKTIFTRLLILAIIIVCSINTSYGADAPSDLTQFYYYAQRNDGYKITLTDAFKAEVNKASGGEFIATNGYVWRTGDALPNPAPDGMYNGINVGGLYYTFSNYSEMTSLDLSKWDTRNVTNMQYMFEGCSSLKSLDLSKFDTSNVTSMYYMFKGCKGLTSLDLSNFYTPKLKVIEAMFCFCSSLKSLDLSKFDTSNVTNMSNMFKGCMGLTSLDLKSFDTTYVTDMSVMFYNCSGLTSLDLSSFDLSRTSSKSFMFVNCGASLDNGGPCIGYANDLKTKTLLERGIGRAHV